MDGGEGFRKDNKKQNSLSTTKNKGFWRAMIAYVLKLYDTYFFAF